ncbi:hypothetical protein ANCCEY_07121 [Ancylostoma ceylanicum]|uniref:Uncharacterized protein n=1 Tax=Ancylostoma ceylanicum TaxID=53326 RepID=A0A0D6LPJ8_9BILA|nr:hypothetical protein ANCCEY_07121 [Ancylostoma ceylanicum]
MKDPGGGRHSRLPEQIQRPCRNKRAIAKSFKSNPMTFHFRVSHRFISTILWCLRTLKDRSNTEWYKKEYKATHWLSFVVDSEIVQSVEGPCTRAYNPRAVEFQYSLNPETTEYDYNDFNSFVYQFTQHRNTIRDEYIGEVAMDKSDLEQLVKYNIFDVDLCQLGKILHGPGGRVMDREKVVIPPDTLRPTVETITRAAPSMFAAKLTREDRLRRNTGHYPNASTKPWGQLNSANVQSAIEQTVNMDCITVFRQMNGATVDFYVIFSKTHRFGLLCDGDLNLEIGRWARLQYIGGDFKPGHFLSSRSLRLINYIAPPRFVDAKRYKMREVPEDIAEFIVILTLRARVWNYGNGDLVIESDDVGPIKVDANWTPSPHIPSKFPKGAVVELDSPYIWPGYTVEEAEYRGRRYAHGVEECTERAVSRQNFDEEQPRYQRKNQARLGSAYSEPKRPPDHYSAQNMNDNYERRSGNPECGYAKQYSGERHRSGAQNENRYESRGYRAEYRSENRDNVPHTMSNTFSGNYRGTTLQPAYSETREARDCFNVRNENQNCEERSGSRYEYDRQGRYESDRRAAQNEDRYESRGDGAENRYSVPPMVNKTSGYSAYSEPRQGAYHSNAQNMEGNSERRSSGRAECNYARQDDYYGGDRSQPQNDRFESRGYRAENRAGNRDYSPHMMNNTFPGNSAYGEPTQTPDRFGTRNRDDNGEGRSANYSECGYARQGCYERDRNEQRNEDRCGNRDYRSENQRSVPPTINKTTGNYPQLYTLQSVDMFQKMPIHGEEPSTRDHMSYSFRLPEEPSSTKHDREDYYFDFRQDEEYSEPPNDYYYNSNNFLSNVERRFGACNIRDDSPERRSPRNSEYSTARQDYRGFERNDPRNEDRYGNRDYEAENQHSILPMMKNISTNNKQWIPPVLPPNEENVVDLTEERPSGRHSCPAWCCVVQIRHDHIICYAPISGIHKILIRREMLDAELKQAIWLGSWINVMCEPRCKREYDDYRLPHFSHIAVEIVAGPEVAPPVENWEQREIHGLFQVLAPYERLEGILSAQLTADKSIINMLLTLQKVRSVTQNYTPDDLLLENGGTAQHN